MRHYDLGWASRALSIAAAKAYFNLKISMTCPKAEFEEVKKSQKTKNATNKGENTTFCAFWINIDATWKMKGPIFLVYSISLVPIHLFHYPIDQLVQTFSEKGCHFLFGC